MHRHIALRARLPTLLLAVCACAAAAAPPERRQLDHGVGDLAAPADAPIRTLACARPFENTGTYTMPAHYSSGSASSDFIPADKLLEVRRVKATLRGSALSAGNLSLIESGSDNWHDMRLEHGAVAYSASTDGALYADHGTRIKFVAYRNGGYDQALTGDYVMSGCLVDVRPSLVTRPDLRVPRLPKERLTPVQPVERPRVIENVETGRRR